MKSEDGSYSKNIEDFLDFLKYVEYANHTANDDESYSEQQTQDILHTVELNDDLKYNQYAKLSKELKAVRRNRRVAKSIKEQTNPIVEWINDNQTEIHSLERLLGAVRKVESKYNNDMHYNQKTDVIERTLGKDFLETKETKEDNR